MHTALRFGWLLVVVGLLSACSSTIHKVNTLGDSKATVISVDARQRFLLVSRKNWEDKNTAHPSDFVHAYQKYCAEPSPDVFSVLAQSASVSGTFGKSGSPAAVNAAAQGAFASAESGTTIPRTQTMNMLREMMYRTCERYLSGALTATEFPIQAARDQRIMVSILAIEQLTGAVTPKPIVIMANGTGSAGSDGAAAAVAIQQSHNQLSDANDAVNVAQRKVTACNATPPTETSGCDVAPRALTDATKKAQDAQTHYDAVVKVASNGTAAINVSTTAGTNMAASDGSLNKAAEATKEIAWVVDDIVMKSFDQGDETDFFCYKVLDPAYHALQIELKAKDAQYNPSELAAACLERITNQQKAMAERYKAEYLNTKAGLDKNANQNVAKLATKLNFKSDMIDNAALDAFIDKYMTDNHITLRSKLGRDLITLKEAQTTSQLHDAFRELPIDVQNVLAQ